MTLHATALASLMFCFSAKKSCEICVAVFVRLHTKNVFFHLIWSKNCLFRQLKIITTANIIYACVAAAFLSCSDNNFNRTHFGEYVEFVTLYWSLMVSALSISIFEVFGSTRSKIERESIFLFGRSRRFICSTTDECVTHLSPA